MATVVQLTFEVECQSADDLSLVTSELRRAVDGIDDRGLKSKNLVINTMTKQFHEKILAAVGPVYGDTGGFI